MNEEDKKDVDNLVTEEIIEVKKRDSAFVEGPKMDSVVAEDDESEGEIPPLVYVRRPSIADPAIERIDGYLNIARIILKSRRKEMVGLIKLFIEDIHESAKIVEEATRPPASTPPVEESAEEYVIGWKEILNCMTCPCWWPLKYCFTELPKKCPKWDT